MKPTLLVLAAGMGSRYGGLKQMDPLGPSGETIIDYSIYDAVKAGFGKVVYIVRASFKEAFEQTVHEKYEGVTCPDGTPLQFDFVVQELDKIPAPFTVPAGREKPWGTAHAVLMAKDVIHEPFAVINGDDFYGKESFAILADWLRAHAGSQGVCSIVGFELDHTLSEYGKVSRGICSYDKDLHLTDVAEHLNVGKEADGQVYGDNSVTGQAHLPLDGKSLCSMNMWGFTPDYFALSEEVFTEFLSQFIQEPKKEYYIPYAVDLLMKRNGYICEVLSTPSRWFGVTFKEDRPGVVAKLQGLADQGIYPTPLWKKD
ncbi:MAG: nucleotidyltransferase [Bacteroidales bacterium]|nr:nucleotidyltransferase [Bacteroidales bacterium]